MKNTTLLFWMIIQSFLFTIQGQKSLRFDNYTTDHGLSDNTIFAIDQDQQGYIWIGTSDGLNRFDGNSFRVFKVTRAAPGAFLNNTISTLLSDSQGTLWIGTRGGGLYVFDHSREIFTYINLNLKINVIRTIMEDHSGNLWIGTNEGLVILNKRTNNRLMLKHDPHNANSLCDNYVNAIMQDSLGNVWIGTTSGGIDKYDMEGKRFSHFNKSNSALPVNEVNTLLLEGNMLWIGTEDKGLIRYDINENKFTQIPFLVEFFSPDALPQKRVKTIQRADKNHLWIGTLGGGLSYYDMQTGEFRHYRHQDSEANTLSKNSVFSIFSDRHHNLWVGTVGGGLNFADKNRKKLEIIRANTLNPNSLSKSSVLSILSDGKQNIWMGTDEGGINVMNRQSGKFSLYMPVMSNPYSPGHHVVSALCRDTRGQIWIGYMDNGIDLWNPTKQHFVHYRNRLNDSTSLSNNSVFCIYADKQGFLWIGTNGGGLNQFNPATGKSIRYLKEEGNVMSLSNNYVTSVLVDGNGSIWIGTFEGLNRFIDGNSTFIRYLHNPDNQNTISSNEITCIVEDRSKNLWIGTYGGLNRFNPEKGIFSIFRINDGLPSNVICGIVEDNQGHLWISTYFGIAVFNPENETFKKYDKSDGLQGNQFNIRSFTKLPSGEIMFGGLNGVSYFFPDSIRDNPYVSPVYLTGIRILNKPVVVGEKGSPLKRSLIETTGINLNHRQNALTFEFTALNFTSSSKCRYRYTLNHFDKTWIDNEDKHTASYTNLPPGEYVFRVQASNSDGIWNATGASMSVTILPPFWKTWWFRLLVITFALGSSLTLHAWRVGNIKRQNLILENKVQIRTTQVVQQKEQIQEQAEYLQQANTEIVRKNVDLEFQKEEIERQAREIKHMNYLLQLKNEDLTHNVEELAKARVMQKRVTYEEFQKIYPNDEACLALLRELRVPLPFICKNCHHPSFTGLSGPFLRRCKACGYREPLTGNTIFYRIKFPITKAFYILYLVSSGRNLTIEELSNLISLRKETCWAFRNKVKDVMEQRKKYLHSAEGWKELILIESKVKYS